VGGGVRVRDLDTVESTERDKDIDQVPVVLRDISEDLELLRLAVLFAVGVGRVSLVLHELDRGNENDSVSVSDILSDRVGDGGGVTVRDLDLVLSSVTVKVGERVRLASTEGENVLDQRDFDPVTVLTTVGDNDTVKDDERRAVSVLVRVLVLSFVTVRESVFDDVTSNDLLCERLADRHDAETCCVKVGDIDGILCVSVNVRSSE
jgi:hypothetical protein